MRRLFGRMSARLQVVLSLGVGVLFGVPVGLLISLMFGLLVGWDVAALVYMIWVWRTIWPLDAARTKQLAQGEDPTRSTADGLILVAAVASLVAVGLLLARAAGDQGAAQLVRIGVALASVLLSWAIVHTAYTLRYAALYYRGPDGGIEFNSSEPPQYSDFAYLAFTLGMTFQVSDTALQSNEIRRTALRHALLSYLFGTGVLATTINLVASLGSR